MVPGPRSSQSRCNPAGSSVSANPLSSSANPIPAFVAARGRGRRTEGHTVRLPTRRPASAAKPSGLLGAAATPSDHYNYSRSPDFADAPARSENQRVNLNAPAISTIGRIQFVQSLVLGAMTAM